MRSAITIAAFGLLLGGCAESSYPRERINSTGQVSPAAATPAPPGSPKDDVGGGQPAVPALPRKIIYNAELDIAVARFAEAQASLLRLVKEQGGYVAQSDIAGSPGAARSGRWVVRIPVDRLDSFEDGILALGELEKRHRDSRDVTEEYYDLDARIKNKQVEEARLLKHLADSTGSLKETLEVERELSRVRGEVEQFQGRLQLLANLTSLTTVTVALAERDRYIPAAAPTFATRVSRTFSASIQNLLILGEGLTLLVVGLVPWMPVAAVVGLPLWLVVHRIRPRVPSNR